MENAPAVQNQRNNGSSYPVNLACSGIAVAYSKSAQQSSSPGQCPGMQLVLASQDADGPADSAVSSSSHLPGGWHYGSLLHYSSDIASKGHSLA